MLLFAVSACTLMGRVRPTCSSSLDMVMVSNGSGELGRSLSQADCFPFSGWRPAVLTANYFLPGRRTSSPHECHRCSVSVTAVCPSTVVSCLTRKSFHTIEWLFGNASPYEMQLVSRLPIRSARFLSGGQHSQLTFADWAPWSLDRVVNLLPNIHSICDIPCIIMASQVPWLLTPPLHLSLSILPKLGVGGGAFLCSWMTVMTILCPNFSRSNEEGRSNQLVLLIQLCRLS